MNNETYSLPSFNSGSALSDTYNWEDCDFSKLYSLPTANSGFTPAEVYSWWNCAEPYRKKKHKKKARKKKKRKQVKQDWTYRLLEKSIDSGIDTINAIAKCIWDTN